MTTIILPHTIHAVAYALAAGKRVGCRTTGEIFSIDGRVSVRRARHFAVRILNEPIRTNFEAQ